jgi:hypothetical protein
LFWDVNGVLLRREVMYNPASATMKKGLTLLRKSFVDK